MNIGMMTAWNQDAGPAICAELIGREWVKDGHNVKIFSYIRSGLHGTAIVGKDEDFVYRCFSTNRKGYLDPAPILESNLDLFVTNGLGMFPMDGLAKIFPLIKRKAKTVNIIHESRLPSDTSFYDFDWDGIICFDTRYKSFLRRVYPPELITIIPHPLHPWKPGDKTEARKKLNLPLDKRIVFVFGHTLNKKLEISGSLRVLSKRHNILLLIASLYEPPEVSKETDLEIEFRKEAPDLVRLYDYLHAADALVINNGIEEGRAVVSTTIFQTLGAGCPVLACDSNPVETVPDEVIIKYRSYEEFEKKLALLFESPDVAKALKKAQEEYVREHSPQKIGKGYIQLFESIIMQKPSLCELGVLEKQSAFLDGSSAQGNSWHL